MILALTLALSLAACGGEQTQTQQPEEQPAENEAAETQPQDAPAEETVQEAAPAEEENPGILTAENDPYNLMDRWQLTAFRMNEEERPSRDLGFLVTYTFKENGVAELQQFGEKGECSYSVSDKEITVVWGFTLGSDAEKSSGAYDPESDTFDLHEELNGTKFDYHFERYSTLHPEEAGASAEPFVLTEEMQGIVGTWTSVQFTTADGSVYTYGEMEMKLVFKDDGTVTAFSQGGESGAGNWRYDDGKIMIIDGDQEIEIKYDGTTIEFPVDDSTAIFEKEE